MAPASQGNRELPTQYFPRQTTPFIGRGRELTEINELLADPACRLLNFVGAGGIGKTRLALEAAEQQLPNFADGGYFVPLASVGSSDLVASSIASALNLSFYGPEEPGVQIVN